MEADFLFKSILYFTAFYCGHYENAILVQLKKKARAFIALI